jgi:hypothetical protein
MAFRARRCASDRHGRAGPRSVRSKLLMSMGPEHNRSRKRRLKAFGHLYRVLNGVDRKKCFYCRKGRATTMDHCPPLLWVDGLGPRYFQKRSITFVLIPACGACNNILSTAGPFDASGRRRRVNRARRKGPALGVDRLTPRGWRIWLRGTWVSVWGLTLADALEEARDPFSALNRKSPESER